MAETKTPKRTAAGAKPVRRVVDEPTTPAIVPAAATAAAEASAEPVAETVEAVADRVEGEAADAAAVADLPPVESPAQTAAPEPDIAAVSPTFASPLDVLKKGLSTMSDTFTPTAASFSPEKAQALLGDLNARAKSAAEKSAKLVEELSEFTKGNVEALVASSKIAAKGAETLGADAAEYSKKSLETATSAFKSFAGVKSPTELFQLQSEFAKSSFDSAVAEASKVSESLVKLAGEVFQPISSRFAVAAEKVKSASL